MATEFKLDITRATLPIVITGEDVDGNPTTLFEKRYTLDLGNKEKIQEIYSAGLKLSDMAKAVKEDATALDQIELLAKGLITASIGDWDQIWEVTRHNVYAVMAIAFHIAKTVKEESQGSLKRYGL